MIGSSCKLGEIRWARMCGPGGLIIVHPAGTVETVETALRNLVNTVVALSSSLSAYPRKVWAGQEVSMGCDKD